MHIEKNVFENVFNTVINVEGKNKDNLKAREDLKVLCRRPELEKKMKLQENFLRHVTHWINPTNKSYVNGWKN